MKVNFANFENSRCSTKNCQFVFGRALLKRGNIPTRSRRLESSQKWLQAHRSPDNPARNSSHRIHLADGSMECFRPFDESRISRMVNCSDHELRPHFSGFQQNTFELIHRSVASISSQDLPVRRFLVADTKTDTKPVKIGLVWLSRFKLICPGKWAFLSRNCGENGPIPTPASILCFTALKFP